MALGVSINNYMLYNILQIDLGYPKWQGVLLFYR